MEKDTKKDLIEILIRKKIFFGMMSVIGKKNQSNFFLQRDLRHDTINTLRHKKCAGMIVFQR